MALDAAALGVALHPRAHRFKRKGLMLQIRAHDGLVYFGASVWPAMYCRMQATLSSVSANSTTLPTSGISMTGERSLPPAASIADRLPVIEVTLIVTRNALSAPGAAGPRRLARRPCRRPGSVSGPVTSR